MDTSGIYIIHNLDNKKVYIGSAVNVDRRLRQHVIRLRAGKHENLHLQNAWNKYGEDLFKLELLMACAKDSLIRREQRIIDDYRHRLGWKMLYNICPIAGSSLGRKFSTETRAKMSTKAKGRKSGPHSPETRLKISIANKGKKKSPEHIAKMSANQKGKQNCLGRKHSAESLRKMSESHKGHKHSVETREKISTIVKGRKASAETRVKMSAAAKLAWERRRDKDETQKN